ncbi:type II toxin-antitoxin system RelE/ParE family toxin [Allosphingosinicella vermicomposti]|uniref:type II toxin-antitoxin system RelE/ParE family toxin n=1 Tax=Allosphingosinicella vermicomposti TaxID=614671 RepID=UPI000D102D1D|nr:type II toxin-antitoxin system RelE/ParE family toxin [Allosphingosinicella vermicomposti]
MRNLLIRPLAEADLIGIWRYTAGQWGEAQADTYLDEIDAILQHIKSNPLIGSDCGDVRPGYRKAAAGSHRIFYRCDAETVEVVRILHARMDVDGQIP